MKGRIQLSVGDVEEGRGGAWLGTDKTLQPTEERFVRENNMLIYSRFGVAYDTSRTTGEEFGK